MLAEREGENKSLTDFLKKKQLYTTVPNFVLVILVDGMEHLLYPLNGMLRHALCRMGDLIFCKSIVTHVQRTQA